jgi:hypothetical protein
MSKVVALAPSTEEWLERCAARLKYLGPLFTDEHAAELAMDLYRAWPYSVPERAADTFLAPEPVAA